MECATESRRVPARAGIEGEVLTFSGKPARRICSLLPSATEIVCALGLADRLVGVTHECDFPPGVRDKPHVTSSAIDSHTLSASEIDAAVRRSLAEAATIYHLDAELLEQLQPDLVLTQELCEVCAVGPAEVQAVLRTLSHSPQLVSLEPRTVQDTLQSIRTVGALAGAERQAERLVDSLQARIRAVSDAVAGLPVRPTLTMEWTDPLFVGGHWVPEMVALAGGRDILGRGGEPSRVAEWDEVAARAPEVVVAMPCGFGLERSRQEVATARLPELWHTLPAVKSGNVFVVDGSSYFNRPGPRIVDGIEVLASILHPEAFSSAPAGSYAPFKPAGAR